MIVSAVRRFHPVIMPNKYGQLVPTNYSVSGKKGNFCRNWAFSDANIEVLMMHGPSTPIQCQGILVGQPAD